MTAIANTQTLHDAVTARIISELEQGRFPWIQPWASSSGGTPLGLPQNPSTGRTYSGINILLLWAAAIEQGRPSQRWLTFKQALALGGNVRKGEKGTMVVYADTFIPKAEQEKASASGEDARRVGFLKRFTVFHVEQCEGLPADSDAAPLPGQTEILPQVEAAIASTGADIRIGGDMAFYSLRTTSSRSRHSKPISKRSTGTGPSCMSSVTGQGMRHVSTAISRAALVVRLMRAKSWLRSFALRFYALNLG